MRQRREELIPVRKLGKDEAWCLQVRSGCSPDSPRARAAVHEGQQMKGQEAMGKFIAIKPCE